MKLPPDAEHRGKFSKNLFVTMLAKELNLKIKIYSRADNEKMAKRLKTLGADYITIPEIAGAKEILEHLPV